MKLAELERNEPDTVERAVNPTERLDEPAILAGDQAEARRVLRASPHPGSAPMHLLHSAPTLTECGCCPLVVVSDGLDVGDQGTLASGITWLSERARAVVWLNPLAVSAAFEPRSRGMSTCLPYLDALFGFAAPADLAEAARQIEQRGLGGPVGYEYDPRRADGGGDPS